MITTQQIENLSAQFSHSKKLLIAMLTEIENITRSLPDRSGKDD